MPKDKVVFGVPPTTFLSISSSSLELQIGNSNKNSCDPNLLLTGMILQVEGIVMSDYRFSGEAGCAENPKDLVEEMWEILLGQGSEVDDFLKPT